MSNRSIIIPAGIIILLFLGAVFASYIAPYDPFDINVKNAYSGPSKEHIFGTDSLGRDVFSRVIYGTRVALIVGIGAVGIATMIGVVLGAISGYYEGWLSSAVMRFTDIMLCFPALFLILAVVAFIGPSLLNIVIVIGITSWMGVARLMRAEIMSLKRRDFILAARAMGKSDFFIINSLGVFQNDRLKTM